MPNKKTDLTLVIASTIVIVGSFAGYHVISSAALQDNQVLIDQGSNFADASKGLLGLGTQTQKARYLPVMDSSQTDYIAKYEKLVIADTGTKEISLYQNGQLIKSYPILSIGTPGKFWETPTGFYDILYTNSNHVSSIGNVNMPFSLQYSGNFFIHGWPTYLDGSDVATGYSGGCIRLDTNDAKEIFDFSPTGTNLLVIDSTTSNTETSFSNLTFTDLSASNYLIAQATDGQVISERNTIESNSFNFAGIAKVITAIVGNEGISYAANLPVLAKNSSDNYYQTGTSLDLDAIYPTLISSNGDDYAATIANYRSLGYFNNEINRKINSLGLENTTVEFSSSSYQSETTMDDMYQIARHLYFQKPFLIEASNQVINENGIVAYFEKTSEGETGFAFIKPINSTKPIVISILKNSPDFMSDVKRIQKILN